MANLSVNTSGQRLPKLGDVLIARYPARDANRARANALAARLTALDAGFKEARELATTRERPGTPIERATFATVAEVDELRAFLLAQVNGLRSSLDALEPWIDYCESIVAALRTWSDYTRIAETSAYWLTTVELHKGRLPSTRRRAVRANFGMAGSVNSPTSYHWRLDQFQKASIDVGVTAPKGGNDSLRKQVLLQSVTELSTLHLLGSFTRPGLDLLGPKLVLVGARVWWPNQPTPQDMLVATVAEHVPGSRWAPKGATPFTKTFTDYIDPTYFIITPCGVPTSEVLGDTQVDWFAGPLDPYLGRRAPNVTELTKVVTSDRDKVSALKYFGESGEEPSYGFTKNAIDYFAQGGLVDAPNDYAIPSSEVWEPRTLMTTIEAARTKCVQSLVVIDELRRGWFKARDALLAAVKRFERQGDPMQIPGSAKGVGVLATAAVTASRQLAAAGDAWYREDAARLRSALQAWDSFIRGDMTPGFLSIDGPWSWRTLSRGLTLSTTPLWQILQSPMALFHFKGKERDVLIHADYFHLYKFEKSRALSPVLDTNSFRGQQIGLCGASGHAMGAHLHVQTSWCDADPADAAECLKEPDQDRFVQWVTNATNASALPSGKKAPGTWRKMPAAFLFPRAG